MSDPDWPDESGPFYDATSDEPAGDLIPKPLIAAIGVMLVAIVLAVPLLRIVGTGNDSGPGALGSADPQARHAVIFASATLESRSPAIAQRLTAGELHGVLDTYIAGLRREDPERLRGATARTERVNCTLPIEGQQCFVARLARDGEPAIAEIAFTVGMENGTPLVVAIRR